MKVNQQEEIKKLKKAAEPKIIVNDAPNGQFVIYSDQYCRKTWPKVKQFIKNANWTFAKTMPKIPHEYIVVGNHSEKSAEIEEFKKLITENGYDKSFYSKTYRYLELGGYKYWVIENIINREKIDS